MPQLVLVRGGKLRRRRHRRRCLRHRRPARTIRMNSPALTTNNLHPLQQRICSRPSHLPHLHRYLPVLLAPCSSRIATTKREETDQLPLPSLSRRTWSPVRYLCMPAGIQIHLVFEAKSLPERQDSARVPLATLVHMGCSLMQIQTPARPRTRRVRHGARLI